jgi:hypothetical protein
MDQDQARTIKGEQQRSCLLSAGFLQVWHLSTFNEQRHKVSGLINAAKGMDVFWDRKPDFERNLIANFFSGQRSELI